MEAFGPLSSPQSYHQVVAPVPSRRSRRSCLALAAVVAAVAFAALAGLRWHAAAAESDASLGAGLSTRLAQPSPHLRALLRAPTACNAVMFGHGVNDRITKEERRHRRKLSIRKKIEGSQEKPRLTVFRSNNHIYGQLIDDSIGHTVAAAGTVEKVVKEQIADKTPKEQAEIVGKLLAERAKEKGIEKVVFDRNGYKFHGRVAAVAEAAREAGLVF